MIERTTLRLALIAAAIAVVVIALLGWKAACTSERRAKGQRDVAVATGEALDRVAEETPAIRQEQEETEREVEQIDGADQRLPDGFGAELERLRRRDRDNDPR